MTLEELLARAEIADVLARYAHAIDRGDRELARTCYHPDATDDHGRINGSVDQVFEFFEEYGASIRSTYHFLGLPLVVLDGERAEVETYCIYRRELVDRLAEVLLQGLRYYDVWVRRDGQWRVLRRTVILDWEHRAPGAPGDASPASWTRGSGRGEVDVTSRITEALARDQGLTR